MGKNLNKIGVTELKASDITWQIIFCFMLELQVERWYWSGFSHLCSKIHGRESDWHSSHYSKNCICLFFFLLHFFLLCCYSLLLCVCLSSELTLCDCTSMESDGSKKICTFDSIKLMTNKVWQHHNNGNFTSLKEWIKGMELGRIMCSFE